MDFMSVWESFRGINMLNFMFYALISTITMVSLILRVFGILTL